MKIWNKRSRRHFSARNVLFTAFIICGITLIMEIPCSGANAQRTTKEVGSQLYTAKDGTKKAKKQKRKYRKGRRGKRGRRGSAKVFVDLVTKGTAVETVQVYGRVIARQTGVVAARTKGAIEDVRVHVGDRVKKGDTIATLISSMLKAERELKAAELKESSAKIRTVGVQLSLANQELERLKRLRKSSAFSSARYQDKLRDVERIQSALIEAKAKREQARAKLRMANINLFNAKVIAPFDGVIINRAVETGDYVSLGGPVVTILNEKSLEVEAEVPANRLGGLTNGIEIDVKPEFGRSFKASVRAIVPQENALSRTRIVRFSPLFFNPTGTIASNQSVVLHIPSGATRQAVTVHKDAITQRRGKRVVFVVKETDSGLRANMRRVELGDAFGLRFEVLRGLKPGDKVVIRGNERLRPRQKIKIAEPGQKRIRRKWQEKVRQQGKRGWGNRSGNTFGGKKKRRNNNRNGKLKFGDKS